MGFRIPEAGGSILAVVLVLYRHNGYSGGRWFDPCCRTGPIETYFVILSVIILLTLNRAESTGVDNFADFFLPYLIYILGNW